MGRVPVARFDSSSGMLRAVGRHLSGRDFPGPVGWDWASPLVSVVNALPAPLRRTIYGWGGLFEGSGGRSLGQVRADALARWVVEQLPRRGAPVAMIGSANGAAVHLAAALGAPWLPQTLLLLHRRRTSDIDNPHQDLDASRQVVERLVAANPGIRVHQMHDPNQDRLMLEHASYLRMKWLRLPQAYEQHLTTVLDRGGTLVVVDCALRWPVHQVSDRHVFQAGALGGLAPAEYLDGSPAAADLLARHGSTRRRWDYPRPDAELPEAEWGFEDALLDDLDALAARQGWRLMRLRFPDPDSLSPVVADLHRDWHRRRGVDASRLVVESFVLLEPWWVLRTGSVPFWTSFGVERSAEALERYLAGVEPYEEIATMLFSHGVRSAGVAPAERWPAIAARAGATHRWLGVAPDKHPSDVGAVTGYHVAMRGLGDRVPLPRPMHADDVAEFVAGHGGPVTLE